MGKINKDALIAFLFWFGYHETISSIVSFGTGWNWWYFQPFVVFVTLLMFAVTFGSQTKMDTEWHEDR